MQSHTEAHSWDINFTYKDNEVLSIKIKSKSLHSKYHYYIFEVNKQINTEASATPFDICGKATLQSTIVGLYLQNKSLNIKM